MNGQYLIKYIDAYYSDMENIDETSLFLHEAYGYVENNGTNLVIRFIKLLENDKKRESVIEGLVLPDTALYSLQGVRNDSIILENTMIGSGIAITWRDIVHVKGLPRYDCSQMYTEGILLKIKKDHIVIRDPETIRTYPHPIKNHPQKKVKNYIIPISFISTISLLNK